MKNIYILISAILLNFVACGPVEVQEKESTNTKSESIEQDNHVGTIDNVSPPNETETQKPTMTTETPEELLHHQELVCEDLKALNSKTIKTQKDLLEYYHQINECQKKLDDIYSNFSKCKNKISVTQEKTYKKNLLKITSILEESYKKLELLQK